MNVYSKIAIGLTRLLLAPVLSWLNRKGIIAESDNTQLVLDIVFYGGVILWSVVDKINIGRWVNTALAMPKGATPADLQDQMHSGQTAAAIVTPYVAPKIF